MTMKDAQKAAAKQLKDDADELAWWNDQNSKNDAVPHMVKVAVRKEIGRLREIAEKLEGTP